MLYLYSVFILYRYPLTCHTVWFGLLCIRAVGKNFNALFHSKDPIYFKSLVVISIKFSLQKTISVFPSD